MTVKLRLVGFEPGVGVTEIRVVAAPQLVGLLGVAEPVPPGLAAGATSNAVYAMPKGTVRKLVTVSVPPLWMMAKDMLIDAMEVAVERMKPGKSATV